MEELKKYIEDTLKDLTKTFFEVVESGGDTESLQAHLNGLSSAYRDILNKIKDKEQ